MSLPCLLCGSPTAVYDTRDTDAGYITRRRECLRGHRATTREEWISPQDKRMWTVFKQAVEALRKEMKV